MPGILQPARDQRRETRDDFILLVFLIVRPPNLPKNSLKTPFFSRFFAFSQPFFADFFNFFQTFAHFAKRQNPPRLPLSTRSSTKSSVVNRKSKIPSPPSLPPSTPFLTLLLAILILPPYPQNRKLVLACPKRGSKIVNIKLKPPNLYPPPANKQRI